MNRILIFIYIIITSTAAMAQIGGPVGARRSSGDDTPSYLNPKEYTIGGTTVSGAQYLDKDVLVVISKLSVGQRILVPGEATSTAVKNLWDQGLFDDVKLNIAQIKGDSIFFEIVVVERPRLTRINLLGLPKGQTTELMKKLEDNKGKIINENLYNTTSNIIKKHYNEKGFLFTEVDFKERKDTAEANNMILDVTVHKNAKVKVHSIAFEGNKDFKKAQLKKYMKKTHEQAFYKVFGSGKFLNDKYEEDKATVVSKMQSKGYRDATIVSDTVLRHDNKSMDITIHLNEGNKYYFGNITWAGNAIYTTDYLNKLLAIQKGDVFSEEHLDKRLHSSANSDDISTLYLDNGYLTFNIDPIQTRIYGDTVDIEMRLIEGPRYTINKVILRGNDITNDKVVMREIRTKPGDKFSKTDIVRTTREIAQLGNFDEQKTVVNPIPNPSDGTVDIEYTVQEKPSDQVELSGGFGGGRVIATLGLTFNNFAARHLFDLKEWKPLPKGDGQKLTLRGQTNGKQYQSYSFSFSEPWFGGKQKVYFGIS
ncbi:MAG TPA: outer membrane protein assembly factor BamA, partial [Sphingobacteriaceae bacterium]|nr:outer membrane protein assembly factor BamA [Sphingobacteriaceae bacterium]